MDPNLTKIPKYETLIYSECILVLDVGEHGSQVHRRGTEFPPSIVLCLHAPMLGFGVRMEVLEVVRRF